MNWVQITLDVTLNNITPLNNLLLNSNFKNFTVGYMFYIFLTCMPIFMPIKCYLPFDP